MTAGGSVAPSPHAEGPHTSRSRTTGWASPSPSSGDLFTKFFRSSTAQEHAIQGIGLGLTIVDSIVRSHGGDITVVSEHLKGSAFTVTFPLSEAPST